MTEQLTLVMGGARSGKTSYAIGLAELSGLKMVYLATATAQDEEMADRISRHQERRSKNWKTIEEPIEIADVLERESNAKTILLVDCATLWLNNLFYSDREANADIVKLLDRLEDLPGPVIIVSNEVGMGIVPENALARAFRDVQGAFNQKLAQKADLVMFMAVGLPMVLKQPTPE